MKNFTNKLLLTTYLFFLAFFSVPLMAQAPNLGAVGDFVLFTASGAVTNTGNSFITGDVGTNTGAITGFGNVNGVMHTSDGATGAATADLIIAYGLLNASIATDTIAPYLSNDTLTAGVYDILGDATLDGNLILDANNNPNAVFILKMDATFSSTFASNVILINGAMSCNVYWKVEGLVSLASQTIMRGTLIANNAAIDLATDVVVDGRILSTTGAITLLNSSAKIASGCGRPILTGPAAPSLLSIGCYAVFTSIGEVTNNGISYVKGDVGTNNGLTTGYDPLLVEGTIHPIPDTSTTQAAGDLVVIYNYLNNLPHDIELLYPAQFGNNLVLTPHTYLMNAAPNFVGSVFLNAEGNTNAVFVIKINGALSTGTFAKVILTNGTQAKNVFWKVDGAVSIADYSEFKGTVIANNGAISLSTGVNLEGRILSTTGLVTTNASTVTGDSVCSSILPLTWLYFRGKSLQQKVLLEWSTADERNVDYFTIERSSDSKSFSELATIKSEANNLTANNFYNYTDNQPYPLTYYRISQTDFDGSKNYFKIINILNVESQDFQVNHYTNGNTTCIQTTGKSLSKGSIELFSMDGKRMLSKPINFFENNNTFEMNHSLTKGVYILVIKSNNDQVYSDKIFIQ